MELKAQREDEGQDSLDKRIGVVEELEVGGLIVEVDGNRPVLSGRFVGLGHLSSPCGLQAVRMRHREDKILKDQDYSERAEGSLLNPVEAGKAGIIASRYRW